MKPTPAEMENGMPRSASAKTPPVAANGTLRKMSAAGRSEPNVKYEHGEDEASASGTTTASRRLARLQVLELPAPADVVAARAAATSRRDALLRLGHERRHVASAHVRLDDDPPPHRPRG